MPYAKVLVLIRTQSYWAQNMTQAGTLGRSRDDSGLLALYVVAIRCRGEWSWSTLVPVTAAQQVRTHPAKFSRMVGGPTKILAHAKQSWALVSLFSFTTSSLCLHNTNYSLAVAFTLHPQASTMAEPIRSKRPDMSTAPWVSVPRFYIYQHGLWFWLPHFQNTAEHTSNQCADLLSCSTTWRG